MNNYFLNPIGLSNNDVGLVTLSEELVSACEIEIPETCKSFPPPEEFLECACDTDVDDDKDSDNTDSDVDDDKDGDVHVTPTITCSVVLIMLVSLIFNAIYIICENLM